jgi:Anti-sigma regulatory factor (Ser/Thr protein kinase)
VAERIALAADLAEIARLNDWIEARFEAAGLAAPLRADMKLCLDEAVTNVISHGMTGIAAPEIEVALEAGPDRAEAVVTDNGPPFDPLAVPLADPITDLETATLGGFGIKLMRETATALSYRREAGQNRLTITCGAETPQPR